MKKKMFKSLLRILLVFTFFVGMIGEGRITVQAYDAAPSTPGGGVANGTYYIRNRTTGQYMTASGTSSASGVWQTTINYTSAQRWRLNDEETAIH